MNEKNDNKKKDVKLPIIKSNKKNNSVKGIITTTNKNKDISSMSTPSQNSLKANSAKNPNLDKKTPQNNEEMKSNTVNSSNKKILRPSMNKSNQKEEASKNNKTNDQINEIINNVNKTRNINTNIINNNNMMNINSFNSSLSSKPAEINNVKKKVINRKKKYKFRIYKPLNPLLAPHEDMSFVNAHNTKEKFYKNLSNSMPRITKEKLKEIKERRNARLEKEKKQIEYGNKKIIDDISGQNSIIKSREIVLNDILNSIKAPSKISHKNAQKILEESGMIEAYKYLIKNLCKNGMPEGNIYDYCSDFIKHFEKVWHKIKFRMLNKQIEEHFKEKKEFLKRNNEYNINNIFYRALEQREEMKFIKKLDKSRSSLKIIKRNPIQEIETNKNSEMVTNINNINIKSNKAVETPSKNKANISEENGQVNNQSSKKNNISSNKLTFNIKLIKDEKEDKTIEDEKENEKEKDKSKEKRKNKTKENESNSKNKNEKKNNETKDKDDKLIVQKEKKKTDNKTGKKGKK